ncbi:MAG: RsmD family RNA methyltransferase, partial [bacterium]
MPRGNKFRLTGGSCRGQALFGPPNTKTRPMQGFLREAIFNILGPEVQEASVLDLFSGTGSIGLEALSRGASGCAFFENFKPV